MKMIKKHNIKPNQKKKKEQIKRHSPKVQRNYDLVNQKKRGKIITVTILLIIAVISTINPISLATTLVVASILITPYLHKNLIRS